MARTFTHTLDGPRWLVLIHQLPPTPAYLRVKAARRLAAVGAVALKNTVYALPRSDGALEDLAWVRKEIVDGGGDATVFAAQVVEGLRDDEVEALFRAARDVDYHALADEIRAALKAAKRATSDDKREARTSIARFERRLEEITALDFFAASGREVVLGLLTSLRERLGVSVASDPDHATLDAYRGRVWVTRIGVHVDRIGSAWLVQRFVDADARFKFVHPKGYVPEAGELRFDMSDGEFTHEGDRCTFEVLLDRLVPAQPGLRAVAEVVHDIDLRDGKFARAETPGVAALIAGIALKHASDEERITAGSALFDQLLAFYARRKESR
jgi:hypothetical protein